MNTAEVKPARNFNRLAIAIVVSSLIISAVVLSYSSLKTTVIKTSESVSTFTHNTTTPATVAQSLSSASESETLTACSHARSAESYPTLVVNATSSTVLCLQVYYYDPAATYTLNVSRGLGIEGFQYSSDGAFKSAFNGASNFSVISSPETLVIGGPNYEDEGATIAYGLTAKPGASGTYELVLSSLGTTYLGNAVCGDYGHIVEGAGTPSYLDQGFSGCTATRVSFASGTPTNSSDYTVINGNVFRNDNLYFQILGIAST